MELNIAINAKFLMEKAILLIMIIFFKRSLFIRKVVKILKWFL